MNILIDTNILIPLENTTSALDPNLAEMRRLADLHGHVLYVHPEQVEEIKRDKNENRRRIVLSRMRQYQTIPSPPDLTERELCEYNWRQTSENDRVDNLLLHALCRGAIHFLITNDNGIHKKAKQSQKQEHVHRLDQFLVFLRNQSNEVRPPPFGIEERYLHEFQCQQPFFDTLRDGYNGFDDWYLKSAADRRRAWCISENGVLFAICIFKEEQSPVITDECHRLDGKALKLCTFKVGQNIRGRKIGERLLYTAFKHAFISKIDYVYLHTYGKEHQLLVNLCLEFGFELAGKYKRDDVYIKRMCATRSTTNGMTPLEYSIHYYPCCLDSEVVNKFIIPIRPMFHNELFADISDTAHGLFAHDPGQYGSHANTIKKAYICNAVTTQLRPGDLLFFFRTEDRRSVECFGIVEQTYRGRDIDIVLPLVSKRTVYSKVEIEEMLNKEVLVILFRYIRDFAPVSNSVLSRAGIIGPIQSVRKISHTQYVQCFAESVK